MSHTIPRRRLTCWPWNTAEGRDHEGSHGIPKGEGVPLQGRQGVEAGIPPAWAAGHRQVHNDRGLWPISSSNVYDLDLTSIKDNAELRKLFLDTTDKSIIVIEDIDAIEVELTTKRKAAEENDNKHNLLIEVSDKNKDKGKVTLSGLLSFVDGLWSACGSERIFVFTTNHVDRLDPALIRRGRMDRHIEMSYCRFEAFKMLAKSYLDITEHSLFEEIGQLLDEIDTTPADVADHLMPRGKRNGEIDRLLEEMNVAGNHMLRVKRKREADDCMACLVETLKKAKMESATPHLLWIQWKRRKRNNLNAQET
ncbi:hypothetical protein PVAP13_8KG279100 [Panicum virgatum]|uniref:ATPase AAA-type core domain-containing protein n=1 Tax=Panicum virgatum TaxID=38727 RepID=A0A8T0PMK0_PANVG|nr:hypothetical protein PVAP13_8KG279100 [Panicum virgatum]